MKSTLCVRVCVCPPHQISEELAKSHVSNLNILSHLPVQSKAVQARVQLFHLFTQESLMFSSPCAHNHWTYFMHQNVSLTDAVQQICELFTDFTLSDEKFLWQTK